MLRRFDHPEERGSTVMQQSFQSHSKYSLSNLALRSIVELERMNAGLDCDPDVFSSLAVALRQRSEPETCAAQFRFVEPGYYEPFERLYRMGSSESDGEVEHIQDYMKKVSHQLGAVAGGEIAAVSTLLPICIALHQELIQQIAGEDGFDTHERSPFSEEPPAGFRPS